MGGGEGVIKDPLEQKFSAEGSANRRVFHGGVWIIICFRTAHYMYIVVQVYFSHMPVIFAGDLAAVRISEVSIIA